MSNIVSQLGSRPWGIIAIGLWGLTACAGVEGEEPVEMEENALEAEDAAGANKFPVCNGNAKNPVTRYVKESKIQGLLDKGGYLGPCAVFGDRRTLGEVALETYVQLNADETPWAIGFLMPGDFFAGLPAFTGHGHGEEHPEPIGGVTPSDHDGENCFDVNGDGEYQLDGTAMPDNPLHHSECIGGFQGIMDFPARDKIAPFKWALVNWNNMGHSPGAVYDIPHFDFHFFTMPYVERNFIRPGPCGLLLNCDDFERAVAPVPEGFINPVYINVGAAEARMGNHMVDPTSPEWSGQRFTETFIFGTYDQKINFWEPMITREYLETHPSTCVDIKLPEFYAEEGYYPTTYCMRYRESRDEYTVSLESFQHREATAVP